MMRFSECFDKWIKTIDMPYTCSCIFFIYWPFYFSVLFYLSLFYIQCHDFPRIPMTLFQSLLDLLLGHLGPIDLVYVVPISSSFVSPDQHPPLSVAHKNILHSSALSCLNFLQIIFGHLFMLLGIPTILIVFLY